MGLARVRSHTRRIDSSTRARDARVTGLQHTRWRKYNRWVMDNFYDES